MNKHFVFGLAAVGLTLSIAGATAQGPARPGAASPASIGKIAPARIAVVDLAAVVRAVSGAAGESIDSLRAKRMAELDRQRIDVHALEMKITEGSGTMTAQARQDLLQEIRRKRDALQEAELRAVGEISTRTRFTEDSIRAHIKSMAAALGYQLVLERGAAGVIFSAPSIDITADVVKSLQSKPAK
ncbi:MAG: OmpH family outer membrane protein [Acidobacteria bacterium]|nr:OmpH family outer membrane protein [Acidobacteriota bacterium]